MGGWVGVVVVTVTWRLRSPNRRPRAHTSTPVNLFFIPIMFTVLGRPAMAARLGPQPALMVLGDEGSEQEDWASTYLMPRALLLVVAGIHICEGLKPLRSCKPC